MLLVFYPESLLTFSEYHFLNVVGQEISDGKASLYHCNYCHKDISGKIRIKCAVCQDFDLCIECFSVGVEVTPHKCNHPYRIMVSTFFSLFHFIKFIMLFSQSSILILNFLRCSSHVYIP